MNKEALEQFEKKLYSAILNILGYPPDPKAQYEFITDPPNLQTMTYLKPSQVTFITLTEWSAFDHPKAFGSLKTWGKELMETMKSEKGRGIDAIINYERSKRAPSGSGVNVITQLKDRAGKVKDKIKGSEE